MNKNIIKINGKIKDLKNKIYKEENTYMLPLIEIIEELGYDIEIKDKGIELIKGPLWHIVIVGSKRYNFARMLIQLEKAPVLKNKIVYIPLDFFTEVLKIEIRIKNEILNFKV